MNPYAYELSIKCRKTGVVGIKKHKEDVEIVEAIPPEELYGRNSMTDYLAME